MFGSKEACSYHLTGLSIQYGWTTPHFSIVSPALLFCWEKNAVYRLHDSQQPFSGNINKDPGSGVPSTGALERPATHFLQIGGIL